MNALVTSITIFPVQSGPLCCNLLEAQKANGEEDDVRVECPIDRSGNNVRPELSGYFR
jgi:hypothetical protein